MEKYQQTASIHSTSHLLPTQTLHYLSWEISIFFSKMDLSINFDLSPKIFGVPLNDPTGDATISGAPLSMKGHSQAQLQGPTK